jgi:hypothetical protein
MLIELGTKRVVAVEPSDAYNVLVSNTRRDLNKVTCLKVSGEKIRFLSRLGIHPR